MNYKSGRGRFQMRFGMNWPDWKAFIIRRVLAVAMGELCYDAVDGDVGKELRKKNPGPHFLQNHHQWLKKFGRDKVHDQITTVVTIMKLCENMDDFRQKFARRFKKSSPQYGIYFCSVASLTIRAAFWLSSR